MMEKHYLVVFDDYVKVKLQKAISKSGYKKIIKQWLDLLEENGPSAGKLRHRILNS